MRVERQAKWAPEEMVMMARKDADLMLEPNIKFMNMELVKYFKNRSAEAIKKVRQKAA